MIAGVVWYRVLWEYGCVVERSSAGVEAGFGCKVCWLWNEVQANGSALVL
jgi:hypothetical protein